MISVTFVVYFLKMIFFHNIPVERQHRIAVSVFFFNQGLIFGSWASRIPDIKTSLGLSVAGLGSMLFFLPIGQLTGLTMSGFAVSKFGSKRVLSVAAILYPTMLLCVGATNRIWQLPFVLFLMGLCGNFATLGTNTQGVGVQKLYEKVWNKSIIASFHGIWSLAGFTGGIISTLMVSKNITPFVHYCIIYSLVITLVLIMRKYLLPRDTDPDDIKRNRIFVRPDKSLIFLGFIAFGSSICEGTMFDWSGIYFQKVLTVPKDLIRLGYVAFFFAMAFGRFTADKMVNRIGIYKMLRISGLIIFTGLMISVLFPYVPTATFGFLLVGLGTSSVIPLCYGLAGKSENMHPGLAIASVGSISFMGILIGPPIIGFIAQASSLRLSFAVIAIMGLTTTVISSKVK